MNNYTDRLQRDKDGTLYGGVGSKLNDARAPLPSSAHLAIHENSKTILKEIAKQKYPQLEGADIVYNNTQKEKQAMFLEGMEYAVSHPELFKTKEEGITGEDRLHKLFEEMGAFVIRAFPECDHADHLEKLKEEIDEVKAAKWDDTEWADCLLCLLGAAYKAGVDYENWMKATFEKLAIIKTRVWEKKENGTYQHVKNTLSKKEEGEYIRKELTEIITDVWATKGATEKNHPFDENAVERSEHKKVRRQYIPEVVNEIMQLFSTLPSTTEGKTDKGWVVLFKDESEYVQYLNWRKEATTENKERLVIDYWKRVLADDLTEEVKEALNKSGWFIDKSMSDKNDFNETDLPLSERKLLLQEKDNTVTEGKEEVDIDTFISMVDNLCYKYGYEIWPTENGWTGNVNEQGENETFAVIGGNSTYKKMMFIDGDGHQPSESSTIPVVDYEKEAIDKAAEIYPLHNGNSRGEDNEQINLRTAYANGYVSARQMSYPSDTSVIPLKWEYVKGFERWQADTPFGLYTITEKPWKGMGINVFWMEGPGRTPCTFDDLDKAKNHTHIEYTDQVLKQITITPSDTNGKLKELIDWLNIEFDKADHYGRRTLISEILEKANSLITTVVTKN